MSTIFWGGNLMKVAGVNITVHGKENIRKLPERVVFISNHASYFDIPILITILPLGCRFVAREDLFRAPFLGWITRNSGHISIERKGTKKTLQTMLKTAEKVKNGLKVIIFPEGSRSPDGQIAEFKKGTLLLATRGDAHIVPIAISGSHKIMAKNKLLVSPTRIKVTIGKAIAPAEFVGKEESDILADLKDQISEMAGQSHK
jgi:1-acyl-sn-glycerol-3-phosphate acyltransferase